MTNHRNVDTYAERFFNGDAPVLSGFIQTCSEYDGDGPLGSLVWYWIKGDEPRGEFAAAVNWDNETDYTPDEVQHGFCRNVPTGIGSDMVMVLVKEGASTRGAYPITFIDVDAVKIDRFVEKRKLTAPGTATPSPLC